MKLIELTQGRVAIVDNEDFAWLSKWKWHCTRIGKIGYAARNTFGPNRRTIRMHVVIMKRHKRWKRGKEVDHIDTCGCNNRKVNLRLATRNEQGANGGLQSNNTSGVTGVNWDKASGKWRAQIRVNGKQIHLGRFVDLDKAIARRRKAEIKYFGEYRYNKTKLCPLWKTGQCPDCSKRARELGLKL